jgi:2-oxo-3-hexenedioate decarboxylase
MAAYARHRDNARMTPETLLSHFDTGTPWAARLSTDPAYSLNAAYADALSVRALRVARGERPLGFKIGFTNRGIWPVYQVFAPIWGTVWDSTVTFCEGEGRLSLDHTCEPRIEPEAVFGFRATPTPDADLDALFDALDWVAPGFEIVQSHLAGWKFAAPDTVADGGLHARLLVGRPRPVRDIADRARGLDAALARARVALQRDGTEVERGRGANVLDGPLRALLHFVQALRDCPDGPDIQPGDVVTTGTWTDAWPVVAGQTWHAAFDMPLSPLTLRLE